MRVAALEPADAPRYRELMLQAYAAAPDAFTSTPEERAAEPLSWWQRRVAHPAGLCVAFGAFDADALVGTVALEYSARPKTVHKAHLIAMFVRESYRGRGAGRALVEAALAHAHARGDVTSVTLTVTQGNAAAIGLYGALGFEAFGVEPMAIRVGDRYWSKVHMWRRVDQRRVSASVPDW